MDPPFHYIPPYRFIMISQSDTYIPSRPIISLTNIDHSKLYESMASIGDEEFIRQMDDIIRHRSSKVPFYKTNKFKYGLVLCGLLVLNAPILPLFGLKICLATSATSAGVGGWTALNYPKRTNIEDLPNNSAVPESTISP